MKRRTVGENRLKTARAAVDAAATAARSLVEVAFVDMDAVLAAVATVHTAADQYIAAAFDYGFALDSYNRIKADQPTDKVAIDDAEQKSNAAKRRLEEVKNSFNTTRSALGNAKADVEATLAATTAAVSRVRAASEANDAAISKIIHIASSAKVDDYD